MQIFERNGLLVAEHGVEHASVQAALREHDDALRLVPQTIDGGNELLWKVYRDVGGDRPAIFICAWMDAYGTPLPLSHGVVDLVKTLDPRERGHDLYVDPDVANERRREEIRRREEADLQTVVEETVKRHGRLPLFPRGLHLRRRRVL